MGNEIAELLSLCVLGAVIALVLTPFMIIITDKLDIWIYRRYK